MASNPSAGARRAKNWLAWFIGFIIVLVALLAGYTWLVLNWSYSAGERAGYVQKFSQKGWLCKTWEGEMAIVAIPGSLPEIFKFTVRDNKVAAAINADMGKRVSIAYEQHVGIPSTCFGETAYYVSKIHVVE
ncbi:MAG: hypothetical protein PHI64_07585 [Zoogloea sp.]|uniref:hypothetical protein n=1 Tax=Zoogloea sp. TaxID=49181 RepID=UPI002631EB16|nr:hypothetical protein [Zoogloea sp.]MDD2988808.1 hypothetical protein [Zoogloea sp.]